MKNKLMCLMLDILFKIFDSEKVIEEIEWRYDLLLVPSEYLDEMANMYMSDEELDDTYPTKKDSSERGGLLQ